MTNQMDYCVAIRTLGTAGEKYQAELDSLIVQTIKPKKILVYIAEGYPLPKETVGIEEYIRCPKGMVAQRALPFHEVNTPLCLFLDDDVYLPPTAVEKLIESLYRLNGDCIAADTFKNQEMSIWGKFKAVVTNWAIPRCDDEWAFKIGYTGTFSYNGNPKKDVYLSQSAAGPCSLWRMDSFRRIHAQDELWMDKNGFAYGEDILYFYKLYRNGGRLLVHYTTGIKHLDAQSSRRGYDIDVKKFYVRSFKWFCIWWRTQYVAHDIHIIRKILSASLYCIRIAWEFLLHSFWGLIHLSPAVLYYWGKGIFDGCQFVHSSEYSLIPDFIIEDEDSSSDHLSSNRRSREVNR